MKRIEAGEALQDEALELAQADLDSHERALRRAADELREINFAVSASHFEQAADKLVRAVAALKEADKQLRPVLRLILAFADSGSKKKEERCRRK